MIEGIVWLPVGGVKPKSANESKESRVCGVVLGVKRFNYNRLQKGYGILKNPRFWQLFERFFRQNSIPKSIFGSAAFCRFSNARPIGQRATARPTKPKWTNAPAEIIRGGCDYPPLPAEESPWHVPCPAPF
jgi:hypothetical protein